MRKKNNHKEYRVEHSERKNRSKNSLKYTFMEL